MRWPLPFLLLLPFHALAQWEPIGTDRPDQTESTETVPMGSFQLKSGFTAEPVTGAPADLTLPQLLLRVGLGGSFELRFAGEHVRAVDAEGKAAGAWGVPLLGLKSRFGQGGGSGIATAMEVNVGVPRWAGDADAHPFAELLLAADRDLGEHWGVGTNLGLAWDGRSPGGTTTATLTAGRSIFRRAGIFAELYAAFPEDAPGDLRWDCGASWAPGRTTLIDASFGSGFQGQRWFVGAGFSIRFNG